MNKFGKAKEITLGVAILLIVVGIIFLTQASSDSTGIISGIGWVFLGIGIIALIAVIAKMFK